MVKLICFFKKIFVNLVSVLLAIYRNKPCYRNAFKDGNMNGAYDIIVAMNGPSLKDDLKKIKSCDAKVVVANHFADTDLFVEIKPMFYLFSDPYFWRSDVSASLKNKREVTFYSLEKLVDWDLTLYLPNDEAYFYVRDRLSKNTNIRCVRFNGTGYPIDFATPFVLFLWKLGLCSPFSQNVLIHSLYCSLMLEPKSIKIVGANYSFHQSIFVDQKTNEFSQMRKHVYGESFEKAYNDFRQVEPAKLSNEFLALYRSYKSLELVELFSREKSIPILNLTTNSFLDMFKRS
ncbi:TPA: hypothetical protein RQK57_004035 [Vibrio vulnificus]|nr:hypothetical protein [Vibrio vulnificus]